MAFLPWAPILDIERTTARGRDRQEPRLHAEAGGAGLVAGPVAVHCSPSRDGNRRPSRRERGRRRHQARRPRDRGADLRRPSVGRPAISISSRHPTNAAKPGQGPDRPPAPAPPPPPKWRSWLLLAGVVVTLLLLFAPALKSTPTKNLDYSQFLTRVKAHQIKTASINPSGAVTGTLKGGEAYTSQIPVALQDTQLAPVLKANDVAITGVGSSSSLLADLLEDFLPLLFFVGVFIWFGRSQRRQLQGGIMGIGGSKAKLYDEDRPTTRFSDVAGYDGAKREVAEVVDFLKPTRALHEGRGRRSPGRAHGGAAGHRQDADGPGRGRRGGGPLPGPHRIELRGDVRGRGRQAGPRPVRRRPQAGPVPSSSSTRSTPSANAGAARSSPTTSGSRPSTSSWPRWTASTPPPAWSSWPPPTGPRSWTRRCCGRVASTARSRSRCPTRPSAPPSWASTPGTSTWRPTSISAPSRGARRVSPAPTWPTC